MDVWFLDRFKNIVDMEDALERGRLDAVTLRKAKEMGFSDAWIAALAGKTGPEIKALRESMGIVPAFKMVDTCAAEFEAQTPYYYSTYDKDNEAAQFIDERSDKTRKKVRARPALKPKKTRANSPRANVFLI